MLQGEYWFKNEDGTVSSVIFPAPPEKTILNSQEIIELCEKGMISPFEREKVRQLEDKRAISFGASGFGYDLTFSKENFYICSYGQEPLDPLKEDGNKEYFELTEPTDYKGYKVFILPPYTFALCQSNEYIKMPADVHGICTSKSTYVRCGLMALNSPAEAGWEGILTIELGNITPRPVIVYPDMGILQMMFFRGNPTVAYTGKYNGQTGTTFPKVGYAST